MRWTNLFLALCLVIPCLTLTACTNADQDTTFEAALRSVDGCEDLLATLQGRALDEMNTRLDRNLNSALSSNGLCWSYEPGGGECSGGMCGTLVT